MLRVLLHIGPSSLPYTLRALQIALIKTAREKSSDLSLFLCPLRCMPVFCFSLPPPSVKLAVILNLFHFVSAPIVN